MPKFYVYRHYIAHVIDVMEVEADDADEAHEESGEWVGAIIGDSVDWMPADDEVLPAEDHNLPSNLLGPHSRVRTTP